ncbi:SHC SH2 domain-binding protein 1 isoform X2 [Anolis carolinensis]|uniref:SHC SH2 domain-binding protein 1 isoform X2 n=1 Tax=Anolis carolinensis TaxID=28377 RepID=UPI002F2B420C
MAEPELERPLPGEEEEERPARSGAVEKEEEEEPRGDEAEGGPLPPASDGSSCGPEESNNALEPDEDSEDSECGSCSDLGSRDQPRTALQRHSLGSNALFPDTFQTNNLLFYERFKAYQDYMLADCKVSEVKEFTAEYLEKLLEPSGWRAVWRTNVFEVLVEVVDVEYSALKAVVRLCEPFLCETRESAFTQERMQELLELKEHRLLLQELWVVFDESGEFDQTALAIEHVRFFYKHIWRSWDEEDDDDFDYFVRCVEPRLRLHYDILEDRVPSALVAEYQSRLSQCEELYRKFLDFRNSISGTDSDSEAENVSVVEGMKLYERMEQLKQKLKLIENPLLRYVFGYQKHSGLKAKGERPSGTVVTHVVSSAMMSSLLQCLFRDKLSPDAFHEEIEIQFHRDPQSAVHACHEGDRVIVCPGHYVVEGALYIADSIELEGYGLPDDIVIEERGKADAFVECTGANVKISSLKLIQHDAVEGILSVHQGKTILENCVLQCETTGVAVRTSAEFLMKNSDLYGAKDFLNENYVIPKITMVNNVIHNNEGYGVVLVKPAVSPDVKENSLESAEGEKNGESAADAVIGECEEQHKQAGGAMDSYGGDAVSEPMEDNSEIANELSLASLKKNQANKKRLSSLRFTEADDGLMAQEMFVSIVGNQFKWNGKGSFGTFLY